MEHRRCDGRSGSFFYFIVLLPPQRGLNKLDFISDKPAEESPLLGSVDSDEDGEGDDSGGHHFEAEDHIGGLGPVKIPDNFSDEGDGVSSLHVSRYQIDGDNGDVHVDVFEGPPVDERHSLDSGELGESETDEVRGTTPDGASRSSSSSPTVVCERNDDDDRESSDASDVTRPTEQRSTSTARSRWREYDIDVRYRIHGNQGSERTGRDDTSVFGTRTNSDDTVIELDADLTRERRTTTLLSRSPWLQKVIERYSDSS